MRDQKPFYLQWQFYYKLFLFCMLVFIFCCFPIVADDWYIYRRNLQFNEILNTFVKFYTGTNGRVLGNGLAVIFINHRILMGILRAGIIWLIPFFACKIIEVKSIYGYSILFLLVLTIPKKIFAQVYSWASGFFNYVPAVLLLLIYIYLMRNLFDRRAVKGNAAKAVITFILGFCTPLFIEHMTIYNMILSLIFVVGHKLLIKKYSVLSICHFIGSVLGTILMFSSPSYSGGPRNIDFSLNHLLTTLIGNYSDVSAGTIGTNFILMVLLSLVCLYLISNMEPGRPLHQNVKRFLKVSFIIAPLYYMGLWMTSEVYSQKNGMLLIGIDFVVTLGYFFSCLLVALYYTKSVRQRYLSVFWLISILCMNGPLLLVTPIGPRNFYASYIFLICFLLTVFPKSVFQENDRHPLFHMVKTPLILLNIAVVLCFGVMFWKVHEVERYRTQLISTEMQKGNTVIELPQYPYLDYFWAPTDFRMGYCYFYEKSQDITFKPIPYQLWKEWK